MTRPSCAGLVPVLAIVARKWPANERNPIGYDVTISVSDWSAFIPMGDVGVDWFADKADVIACRLAAKLVKAEIRRWAK